uniref:Uncharacterized protein n=1 Tax=Denticeps clupeoides TaxID=299321 RepID=A0AAY4E8Z9_9TELE
MGLLECCEELFKAADLYELLGISRDRAKYDEQGVVEEEEENDSQGQDRIWEEHWRLRFPKINSDIVEFEMKYKGSEEERTDVLYQQHRGDMDAVTLRCCQEDEPRFSTRKKKADGERLEAEEMQRETGLNADDSLVRMLKQRQKSREQGFNAFLSELEAKYSKKTSSSGRKGGKIIHNGKD